MGSCGRNPRDSQVSRLLLSSSPAARHFLYRLVTPTSFALLLLHCRTGGLLPPTGGLFQLLRAYIANRRKRKQNGGSHTLINEKLTSEFNLYTLWLVTHNPSSNRDLVLCSWAPQHWPIPVFQPAPLWLQKQLFSCEFQAAEIRRKGWGRGRIEDSTGTKKTLWMMLQPFIRHT